MAANYTEPIYYSDLFGKEMEVEEVVDTINSTNDINVRRVLLLELHQHLLDFDCPVLKKTLSILNLRFGHKRYEKSPTSAYMLQPGADLENTIFRKKIVDPRTKQWVEIDMCLLQQWIRDSFLPLCTKNFSWFALWRFLNDRSILKNTKFINFCSQMNDWLFEPNSSDSKKPIYKDVCSYNGYLSETPYQQWDKQEFIIKRRNKKQTEEGFDHLQSICFSLAGKWIVRRLYAQIPNRNRD